MSPPENAVMPPTPGTLPLAGIAAETAAAVVRYPALRQIKNLPGARAWLLVGNTLQIKVDRIHLDIEHWCLRFRPLFRVYLGHTPLLVVASHKTVSALLRERPDWFRRPSVTSVISAELGGLPNIFNAREPNGAISAAW